MKQGWKVLGFASAFTILGVTFHSAASGSVNLGGLLSMGVFALILAVPSSRIRINSRSVPVLFAALFAGQLLMHVLMTVTSHAGQGRDISTHSLLPNASMTLAHMLAALISTGIVFYAGTLAQAWSRFLASLVGVDFVVAPLASESVIGNARPVTSSFSFINSSEMITRGPPLSPVFI